MSAKVYSVEAKTSDSENATAAHRAVPLSTFQIVTAAIGLSVFSFLYLGFAQRHALLFYIMTGLIAVYILFVYTSGIFAVLYMVVREYPLEDFDEKSSVASREVEESEM